MNKKIQFEIKDDDLDKVSGGAFSNTYDRKSHFFNPYYCEGCGRPIDEIENAKAGDVCPYCETVQTLNPANNEGL